MNSRQREVLQAQLDEEKKILKELKKVYSQALVDCEKKIMELTVRKDLENLQSIVYQKQYQKAIRQQLEGVLKALQSNSYEKVSEYLSECYQNGYIGVAYDLHGQKIPLMAAIDQRAVLRAVQTDSKISKGLYDRLGEDVQKLKTSISAEVSRSIAAGLTWAEAARNLTKAFKATEFSKAYNNAMRIVRTEGHRIQVQSAMDAQQYAKEKGADIVKQWDATLDGRTRPAHAEADGQIRELDEDFDVGGEKMPAPGVGGSAANVCNCRCALLQRARWALGEEELDVLKKRAEFFGLDKTTNFEDFKKKYMRVQDSENVRSGIQKINDNEKKAVFDYMGFKSYVINEKLRNGSLLTNEEKRLINDLNSALDKMPSYKGNLQRSLEFRDNDSLNEFLANYEVGKTIKYNEFISTTKGDIYNPEGQVQIYIQDAKNGRDISVFNEAEQEVLYKNNSLFNVLKIKKSDGKYYILLGKKEE